MNNPSILPPLRRRVFCNRTLNLRAIKAIGFDMDYTLVHYDVTQWEESAYQQLKQRLSQLGWPVSGLKLDPEFAVLGLVLDLEHGNTVKANRFGYVKAAYHGTERIDFEQQKKIYSRVLVNLAEPRWVFLNTLFSLSEACMYAQLVHKLDRGKLPGRMNYGDLYRTVRQNLDQAHAEGQLKHEITSNPDRYVLLDEETPLALLDLKHSGKKLMLITNSDWFYTRSMMAHAFDRFLPAGTTWRDLFHLVVLQARKPSFFDTDNPFFEVMDDEGFLKPVTGPLKEGGIYFGGNAGPVEDLFSLSGEEFLYVGDHIFADVHMSKSLLRWRTALVLKALEEELSALEGFQDKQRALNVLMAEKEALEHQSCLLRLQIQRREIGYGPDPGTSGEQQRALLQDVRQRLTALDDRIGPLARKHAELRHPRWGLLLRTGNDKSHLARQIERYADLYTSSVSNLLHSTPFAFFRSPYTTMPHDQDIASCAPHPIEPE